MLVPSVNLKKDNTVSFEETMRSPLSSVSIKVRRGQRDCLPDVLRSFADSYGFALRLSTDPTRPDDHFVQMYRSDVKMIGYLPALTLRLDLNVYRTLDIVPGAAIRQAVDGLKKSSSKLPGIAFEETVFEAGDDMSIHQSGILPVLRADIQLEDSVREELRTQIAAFAVANGFALTFTQTSPNPKAITFDMYRENLWIFGHTPFSMNQLRFAIYRSGDRTATFDEIEQTFIALQRTVERVPGVSFARR
jgi:hypothetical protein